LPQGLDGLVGSVFIREGCQAHYWMGFIVEMNHCNLIPRGETSIVNEGMCGGNRLIEFGL